jgi:hypothetical protein
MQGSLQNRLITHEAVPPPAVWDNISKQLDEDFVASDLAISSHLENISVNPPASAWDNISSAINEKKEPARIVPLFYKRMAIAVILAAVLAVGAMYFFTGDNAGTPYNTVTENEPQAAEPFKDQENKQPQASVQRPNTTTPRRSLIASNDERRQPRQPVVRQSYYEPRDLTSPAPQLEEAHGEFETVAALQPIAISAPPIRDSRGNIIMDMNVITGPDDRYIVVTGPNGNQTKISNKFVNCLRYINNNFASSDMDAEGRECKTRFEEWRKKLLSEAAFVPAANNFFDIFELKEMIQD